MNIENYNPYDRVLEEISYKEIEDAQTGEKFVEKETKKKHYGKHFLKVFTNRIYGLYALTGNKQVDVINYILMNTDWDNNVFHGSCDEISETLGVSKSTVISIMNKMQKANYLRLKSYKEWYVDPDTIMRGYDGQRIRMGEKFAGIGDE